MSIASHSRGALRRTASSQRAAAVLNVVDKLVDQVDARLPPTFPVEPHSPANDAVARGPKNPDCYNFAEDEAGLSPRSGSDRSDSSAVQGRAPIPDGPIYSQMQRQAATTEDIARACIFSERDCRSLSPQRDVRHLTGCASPRMGTSPRTLESEMADVKLEEARQSNRLVHRALAAVQQQLRVVEQERNAERAKAEQLRRERDFFKNIVMRFPFLAATAANAAPSEASQARASPR